MNLYDLLDVDESATRDEIRAAWKAATADLDPTDRRFRAFNDAAGVLLDEDKRAAYDAELAADREADEEPVVAETAEGPATDVPAVAEEPESSDEPATPVAAAHPATSEEADDAPAPTEAADAVPPAKADGPPRWAFIAAVAAAVVSLLLLVAVLALPGTLGGDPPSERADAASEAARSAEDAVSELVPVVLAYNYKTFDEDVDRASAYLTDAYAAERDELFESTVEVDGEQLTFREQVVKEKLVVNAAVTGTGLTRVSEGGDVAKVVAFINQESRKGDAAPQPLRMWATLTLQRDDGRWLLDDICTESDCF
ncbi:Mce-associated membrane protein [Nocardioides thalensis]|uniref:Mce-associated membrane protein n=1 Tax=Nocardioides thalensis TaxID=1914755 RepID=A0A853BY06_9ACTN|nr:hypothetical protein [Nocardioides thalensis]NYI99726.1 Mce-associated membrane protein [Nocardioides thalensis]